MRVDARLVTALALIPLALGITLYGSPELFAGFCALAVLAGAWEWATLTEPSRRRWKLVALVLALSLLALCYRALDSVAALYIVGLSLLWWGAALVLICRYRDGGKFTPGPLLQAGVGVLVLLPAWVSMVALHAHPELDGPVLVGCLLIMIWAADSGAYYAGRRWGRRKLAVHVSPGKTLEGLLAALVAGLVAASVCALQWLQMPPVKLALFIPLCLLTIATSVVGDLTESMIKRGGGVKDSSELLPGHGGTLDRIDSLTAAAPVFYSGVLLLEAAS